MSGTARGRVQVTNKPASAAIPPQNQKIWP